MASSKFVFFGVLAVVTASACAPDDEGLDASELRKKHRDAGTDSGSRDAAAGTDAASPNDAGTSNDTGSPGDASSPNDAASSIDASSPIDASPPPPPPGTGWTTLTPSSDTVKIYVSNSGGNDANDGLSEAKPVKTIAKGRSLVRDGHPDWLLLKKGDVWKDQAIGYLCAEHGPSPSEPMVISSYGTGARPLIKTNPTIDEAAIGAFTHSSGGCPTAGNNVAIVGLEFYAYTRDPSSPDFNPSTITGEHSGMRFVRAVSSMLIEDCKFSFYQGSGFDTAGGHDITFRRNVVADAYCTTAHSVGLFTGGLTNLLLEENVFDHNGWNASISGAEQTIFNHNIYIHDMSGPSIVRGNITANASSHGLQQRSGGTTTDNLFVRNPLGMEYGSTESATYGPMKYDGTATKNVFLEGNDIGDQPRGAGISVYPDAVGVKVSISDNIFAHEASAFPYGVGVEATGGTSGVTITNNIVYDWDGAIQDNGSGNVTSPNAINASGYPDPNRSVASYNASLGGGASLTAFLAEARKQSKDNWRPQYTAAAVNTYIRAGFGK